MFKDKTIGVVIPAYNEERLIEKTIRGIPDFVDRIIVVDDCSKDKTGEIVTRLTAENKKIFHITHTVNRGVGGAISTGYIYCRDHGLDVAVVMAGDNQMDPLDLPAILEPVVTDRTDYAKGNRLITGEAWKKIPRIRYLGNSALSFMTKIASGYWHVADSQTGYTAINKKALSLLPLENIYPRYGMPNDFLVSLNIYNMRVMDVPVRPVYEDETSGIKYEKIIFSLFFLLIRLHIKRMVQKYIIRDFHPLVFFYFFGSILFVLDIPLLIRFISTWIRNGSVPEITFIAILLCTISGLQLVLFAMLFDMESNRDTQMRRRYQHIAERNLK
ncbi:MAG: glycosyltransferase family 2 protein [Anaerolineaceae bacterium]